MGILLRARKTWAIKIAERVVLCNGWEKRGTQWGVCTCSRWNKRSNPPAHYYSCQCDSPSSHHWVRFLHTTLNLSCNDVLLFLLLYVIIFVSFCIKQGRDMQSTALRSVRCNLLTEKTSSRHMGILLWWISKWPLAGGIKKVQILAAWWSVSCGEDPGSGGAWWIIYNSVHHAGPRSPCE